MVFNNYYLLNDFYLIRKAEYFLPNFGFSYFIFPNNDMESFIFEWNLINLTASGLRTICSAPEKKYYNLYYDISDLQNKIDFNGKCF